MAKSKRSIDRRRKLARDQERSARRHSDVFPTFEISAGSAPPNLVQAVHDAMAALRRDYESTLGQATLEFLRLGSAHGFPTATYIVFKNSEQIPGGSLYRHQALAGLGEAVFARIPGPLIEAHLPYHTFEMRYGEPHLRRVRIQFRSLLRKFGLYYSSYRPMVRVGGQDLVVGFSEHAVLRICERAAFDWRTYAGAGHAFSSMNDCVYYENVSHQFGRPCFAVYGRCVPDYAGGVLAEQVLGRPVTPGEGLYYRIGYCPSVTVRGFLKAKTLLLPGMESTPERRALEGARLPPTLRAAFGSSLEAFFAQGRLPADAISVLGWFHDNGVPQVVPIAQPVFRIE